MRSSLFAVVSLTSLLTACGGDSNSSQDKDSTAETQARYDISITASEVSDFGVSDITATVIAKDGSSVEGQTITITPNMLMTMSGMTHGTPMSETELTLDENGQATTTAYYLMPSMMGDNKMGDWSMNATFDGESVTQALEVMKAGHTRVSGVEDMIMKMDGSTEERTYYVFTRHTHLNDDDNMQHVEVFIAGKESMHAYSPIFIGATLTSGMEMPNLSITEVSLEVCLMACEEAGNWKTAEASVESEGIYSVMLPNMMETAMGSAHIRLTINDEAKVNGESTMAELKLLSDGSMSEHGGH